jgi:hypothetical protein
MNLMTTKTLESVLSLPPYFLCNLFIGSIQGRLVGSAQGRLVWRDVSLEGSLPGGLFLFFCVFFFLSCLRGWINFLFFCYQMVYACDL